MDEQSLAAAKSILLHGSFAIGAAGAGRVLRGRVRPVAVAILWLLVGSVAIGAIVGDAAPGLGASAATVVLIVAGSIGFVVAPSYESAQLARLLGADVAWATKRAVDEIASNYRQCRLFNEAGEAIGRGDRAYLERILGFLVDVNQIHYGRLSMRYRPLLHQAAMKNSAEIVKLLLARDARIESVDTTSNDASALHLAAQHGSGAVVEALLDAGAEVNAKDARGATPLWYAADRFGGGEKFVRLLLDRGADAATRDASGQTVADWVSARGFLLQRDEVLSVLGAPSLRQNGVHSLLDSSTHSRPSLSRVDFLIDAYSRLVETGVAHWKASQLYPESLLPASRADIEAAILEFGVHLSRQQKLDRAALDTLRMSYATLAQFVPDELAILARAHGYTAREGRHDATHQDSRGVIVAKAKVLSEIASRMDTFSELLNRRRELARGP